MEVLVSEHFSVSDFCRKGKGKVTVWVGVGCCFYLLTWVGVSGNDFQIKPNLILFLKWKGRKGWRGSTQSLEAELLAPARCYFLMLHTAAWAKSQKVTLGLRTESIYNFISDANPPRCGHYWSLALTSLVVSLILLHFRVLSRTAHLLDCFLLLNIFFITLLRM